MSYYIFIISKMIILRKSRFASGKVSSLLSPFNNRTPSSFPPRTFAQTTNQNLYRTINLSSMSNPPSPREGSAHDMKPLATKLLEGELFFVNNVELNISVEFDNRKPSLIQLDTGASYSQISSHFAEMLKLKSHPKLIGISRLGNGSVKYDYLAVVPITLNGIRSSLVFKIAPNQPHLLGLDAMIRFDLVIDPVRAKFTQGLNPIEDQDHQFHFINLKTYMTSLGIQEEDLVPIQDLPNPQMSYKTLLEAGTASCVIDLGTSYQSCVSSEFPGLYLGRQ